MKVTKRAYLHTFTFIILLLGIVRLCTDVDHKSSPIIADSDSIATDTATVPAGSDIKSATVPAGSDIKSATVPAGSDIKSATVPDGADIKSATVPDGASIGLSYKDIHTFSWKYAVANYDNAFPDAQDVQVAVAEKIGVTPVANRADAEKRKAELVYVGANPYFVVDKLHSSIPYLVPRASVLLQDIGRAFYDSLTMKSIPLHTIIITSILRSKEDVAKLRTHNQNATENSCHLYGTTFDIAQNRFVTVEDPEGPHRRAVTNDTLKWVLSEVLRDMREKGRCYIKYEKHQGCFHISVR